ncbi:alpha/beta hydrolase [Chitinophagaceae bacterium LB-8]|uniref:Alpha/beta hydrolase n=1 Tax=Paraflavisolibacter caeni TaxID=2982496 RepID=A0A9X2XUU9_9BACT|nr:alpha/beta hydrolase [Paraflavisolibacter caeni]MCU7549085.1 alpha/beta hydrolase [Paraflavisolibacter caeni]
MQTAPSRAGEIPYGNNPKAEHYVSAGDARIYYEVYGKGQPLVILHGGVYGSTYEMAEFIDSLKKDYQVIAVSTRGHGKSEIGSAPLTFEQKANDVYAVIQAVTKDSVLVLGFSDGAYTGYKLASMYPERVKKLIAIGAGEMYPGPRSFHFSTKEAFSLDSLYWKQQLALMPDPGKLQEWFTKLADFYSHLTVGKALFATIKCPVLLMAGELDQNASLPTVVNAYHMILNSQLSIIPNATHGVFLENFPAVWTSMVPFLKQ